MLTTGLRIKKIRELKGYSQAFMANRLGISQGQYSYIENKQNLIPESILHRIADLLTVTPDFIVQFNPESVVRANLTPPGNPKNEIPTPGYEELIQLVHALNAEIKEMKKNRI